MQTNLQTIAWFELKQGTESDVQENYENTKDLLMSNRSASGLIWNKEL